MFFSRNFSHIRKCYQCVAGVVVSEEQDFSSLNKFFIIKPIEIFYENCAGDPGLSVVPINAMFFCKSNAYFRKLCGYLAFLTIHSFSIMPITAGEQESEAFFQLLVLATASPCHRKLLGGMAQKKRPVLSQF